MLAQVAKKGCGISILGGSQNLPRQHPLQPDVRFVIDIPKVPLELKIAYSMLES